MSSRLAIAEDFGASWFYATPRGAAASQFPAQLEATTSDGGSSSEFQHLIQQLEDESPLGTIPEASANAASPTVSTISGIRPEPPAVGAHAAALSAALPSEPIETFKKDEDATPAAAVVVSGLVEPNPAIATTQPRDGVKDLASAAPPKQVYEPTAQGAAETGAPNATLVISNLKPAAMGLWTGSPNSAAAGPAATAPGILHLDKSMTPSIAAGSTPRYGVIEAAAPRVQSLPTDAPGGISAAPVTTPSFVRPVEIYSSRIQSVADQPPTNVPKMMATKPAGASAVAGPERATSVPQYGPIETKPVRVQSVKGKPSFDPPKATAIATARVTPAGGPITADSTPIQSVTNEPSTDELTAPATVSACTKTTITTPEPTGELNAMAMASAPYIPQNRPIKGQSARVESVTKQSSVDKAKAPSPAPATGSVSIKPTSAAPASGTAQIHQAPVQSPTNQQNRPIKAASAQTESVTKQSPVGGAKAPSPAPATGSVSIKPTSAAPASGTQIYQAPVQPPTSQQNRPIKAAPAGVQSVTEQSVVDGAKAPSPIKSTSAAPVSGTAQVDQAPVQSATNQPTMATAAKPAVSGDAAAVEIELPSVQRRESTSVTPDGAMLHPQKSKQSNAAEIPAPPVPSDGLSVPVMAPPAPDAVPAQRTRFADDAGQSSEAQSDTQAASLSPGKESADAGPAVVELKIRPQEPAPAMPTPQAEPLVHAATVQPLDVVTDPAPMPPNSVAAPVIVSPTAAQAQIPVAKHDPPATPTAHAGDIPPEPDKQPSQPLRSISIEFAPDGAEDVRVRLAEHAGDVHVSLHSTDAALGGRLVEGVNDLIGTLSRAGYDAEAWTPGQDRQNQRQPEEQRQNRPDESGEADEEFGAMFGQSNEEVS